MNVANIISSLPGRQAKVPRDMPKALSQMVVPADAALCAEMAYAFPAHSSLFGSAPWVASLKATYGFNLKASVARRGGNLLAALLFADIEDLRGHRLISLPFSDYLDPIAHTDALWHTVVDPLLQSGLPLRLRCLNGSAAIGDQRFSSNVIARWHAVTLLGTEQELWNRLKGPARQNVRKAEQHGLRVGVGNTIDDLNAFYGLHHSVRKSKYRLFAQPFRFFEELRSHFAHDDLFVLLARDNGVPVAGILFVIQGNTLYYKFNASSDLRFRPNDLLVWNAMKMGRERGLTQIDFGLSDLSQPGLIRFKEKFATERRDIVELRWIPEGYDDSTGNDAGLMLRDLTTTMTSAEVPDRLTRAVGDQLYRFFA